MSLNLISAFIGLLMVTMGRQLYWLFVAGIGFIFGIFLATEYYSSQSDWVMLFIALLAGVAGGLFAYSLQNFAIAASGILTGGYLVYTLLLELGSEPDVIFYALIILGGLVGLLIVLLSVDWALIILSSLAGATLIVQSVQYGQTVSAILFFSLSILGIIIQTLRWRQEPQHI
jgi:hypothetical protein